MTDPLERVARAMFEALEHYDPTPSGDGGWDGLDDSERDVWRHAVRRVLDLHGEDVGEALLADVRARHAAEAKAAEREIIDSGDTRWLAKRKAQTRNLPDFPFKRD